MRRPARSRRRTGGSRRPTTPTPVATRRASSPSRPHTRSSRTPSSAVDGTPRTWRVRYPPATRGRHLPGPTRVPGGPAAGRWAGATAGRDRGAAPRETRPGRRGARRRARDPKPGPVDPRMRAVRRPRVRRPAGRPVAPPWTRSCDRAARPGRRPRVPTSAGSRPRSRTEPGWGAARGPVGSGGNLLRMRPTDRPTRRSGRQRARREVTAAGPGTARRDGSRGGSSAPWGVEGAVAAVMAFSGEHTPVGCGAARPALLNSESISKLSRSRRNSRTDRPGGAG